MIVIDVETLNSPRYAQPQISFRRTEADRKPSRPFVRPNDVAPTWEEREAESARRLHAITVKRNEAQRISIERMDAPKEYMRPDHQVAANIAIARGVSTRRQIMSAIAKGQNTIATMMGAVGVSDNTVRRCVREMRLKGWVTSKMVPLASSGPSAHQAVFSITQDGERAMMAPGVMP